jgi:hypothetical protein
MTILFVSTAVFSGPGWCSQNEYLSVDIPEWFDDEKIVMSFDASPL